MPSRSESWDARSAADINRLREQIAELRDRLTSRHLSDREARDHSCSEMRAMEWRVERRLLLEVGCLVALALVAAGLIVGLLQR